LLAIVLFDITYNITEHPIIVPVFAVEVGIDEDGFLGILERERYLF